MQVSACIFTSCSLLIFYPLDQRGHGPFIVLKWFLLPNASATHCSLCLYILIPLPLEFPAHHLTENVWAKVTLDLHLGESSRVLGPSSCFGTLWHLKLVNFVILGFPTPVPPLAPSNSFPVWF